MLISKQLYSTFRYVLDNLSGTPKSFKAHKVGRKHHTEHGKQISNWFDQDFMATYVNLIEDGRTQRSDNTAPLSSETSACGLAIRNTIWAEQMNI